MSSLRRKINLGFYALAATLAVVALFALTDLRFLEQRIELEITVSDFVDGVLELRRYEKNYLLYGADDDYRAVRSFGAKASRLLEEQGDALGALSSPAEVRQLQRSLAEYRSLFAELQAIPADGVARRVQLQRAIRESGRVLSGGAEAIAQAQRTQMLRAVGRSQVALPVAITVVGLLGLVIAQRASRAAVTPLARLHDDLQDLGRGQFDRVEPPSNDREIVAVADAINTMLDEIDTRRRHLVQSEKLASLGTLVAGVAHELNNPLSNVSSSCQILLEELDQADEAQLREWLQQIDTETERARHIVRTLLEFSRERAFTKHNVSLRTLIDKSLLLLGRQAAVRARVNVDIPTDLVVPVDEQRMQQVLVNLVKNALDAGGDDVNIQVSGSLIPAQKLQLPAGSVYAQSPPQSFLRREVVLLSVSDDGPGIPEEALRRVFDPFYTTKDVGRGSGLGLFVTQEIVHKHDGYIAAYAKPGAGSAFFICLPYTPEDQAE